MASLLLPVVLLFATAEASPTSCSTATRAGLDVRYPFSLNSSGSDNCGYPGLGLACENNASLTLSVQSHRYRVVGIDYSKRTVADTDAAVGIHEYGSGCPRLHWNITNDYTSTWLQLTPSDSNITFLYTVDSSLNFIQYMLPK